MQYSMIKWKVVLTIFLVSSLLINAQNVNVKRFQYLSPVPGSNLNSPETNIIIRFGNAFSNNNIANSLSVVGNKSGYHQGKMILAENGRTLVFKPKNQFAEGEVVTVKLRNDLRTISDEQVPVLQYSFKTSRVDLNKKIKSNHKEYLKLLNTQFKLFGDVPTLKNNVTQNVFNQTSNKFQTIQKDSLPDDFPKVHIDSIDNPTPGCISYAPFGISNYSPTYLIITDRYGVPVFYKKMNATAFDFKALNDSTLTYFRLGVNQYYLMNNSYEIMDSVSVQNGYVTDLHDMIRLENGHTFLLSYDYEKVPMDTVVAGGDSNATVIGIIMQELDENKNVVFQWRSWDHYKITDATYDINLTASTVDYVHSNSIEIDYDGDILLSSRYFDEITKINRQTGDIIWRLGGKYCKNNQFTFLNDEIGFSHQHDVRRLSNGNITLFDNGNLHSPRFSRVAEYQVDEVNKFVSLVWEYKNDPQTYSPAMGSARRLFNHNTIIGWGVLTTPVSISEVRPDGTISFYLTMPDTLFNYRAFKFPWKTNLFVTNPDSLNFGYIPQGDSSVRMLSIINNSDKEIKINGILNRDSAFTMLTPLPIVIGASGHKIVHIQFKPKEVKSYSDNLYLQWNKKGERITQVVKLSATTIVNVENSDGKKFNFLLSQNYPNPFNPATRIEYSIPQTSFVTLKVYDILGREVVTLVNEEKPAGNYVVEFSTIGGSASGGDAYNLSSGIYFYKIKTGNFVEVKKMILMK
jgi:hypothetical protein